MLQAIPSYKNPPARRFSAAARVGAALALSALFSASAFPCLICDDLPGDEEKRVEEMIATRGAAALGELREIFPCPTCPIGARIAAARAVGDLRDKESIPELRSLVLALLDPSAPGPFGIMTGAGGLRVAAAASLHRLGAPAAGEEIARKWKELSSERQEEVPRLLGEFAFPDLQENLIEIMRARGRDPVAFQAVVELRRTGDAGAAPAVREKIEEWRRQGAGTVALGRMIRYSESTLRLLLSRPVGPGKGTPGTSGTSATPGTSGTSATPRTSGTSATPGTSGTSATPRTSGTSATPGKKGT